MTMKEKLTLKGITPAQRRLVKLMLDLNFGQIEILRVVDGEPCFDPPPRIVREFVFGKDDACHPCIGKKDFVLKKQVMDLLEQIGKVKNGKIRSLSVQDGLPVRMKLEKMFRA